MRSESASHPSRFTPGKSLRYPTTRTGRANPWRACPRGKTERILWHAAFTAVPIFYLFCPISISKLWRTYIYTAVNISDCVQSVYELPLLQNNTESETFLHKSEWCEVLTRYLSLGCRLAVTGRIRDIGQEVLQSTPSNSKQQHR
jgi:hypothetical protein